MACRAHTSAGAEYETRGLVDRVRVEVVMARYLVVSERGGVATSDGDRTG